VATSPASIVAQPTTTTTTATATSGNVQIYVNGQLLGIRSSTQTSTSSTGNLSYLEELFASVSSGTASGSGTGTTQVQIWNA
jgi:hypothetical protein